MLGPLIISVVTGEAGLAAKRAKAAAGAYGLAAGFSLVGILFLLVAAFIAVAQQLGAVRAALALGGGFLLVGILIAVLHRTRARAVARRDADRRAREASAIASAAAATALPPLLAGRHSLALLGMGVAAAAGYAILRENSSPKRRPAGPSHFP